MRAPSALPAGTRLGPYLVQEPLGAGGMGEVYRAHDPRLGRQVAIKVLPEPIARGEEARKRFEREARAVAALSHPNILAIHDVGSEDGRVYAVMELLEGETLRARLERGPLPWPKATGMASAIADGLATAHAKGIVHRDLKPANIFLTADGRVKVLDFGLAKLREPADPEDSGRETLSQTDAGRVTGTVGYMSPEQVAGRPVDARSDIFSLGCVLYEMATGHRAFARDTPADTLAAVLHEDPFETRTTARRVPLPLERIIRRCLEKNPDERFQAARDIGFALEEAPRDVRSRPHVPWLRPAAGATLAVLVALLATSWWPRSVGDGAPRQPPPNPRPVIVLMDSPLTGRVYDPRTEAAGGTNADDITDALRELPVLIEKENTSPMWHREEQVLRQNPDLIVSHLSCLFDERVAAGNKPVRDQLFDVAVSRLLVFFGYVASSHSRTRFLVYSRGAFNEPGAAGQWMRDAEARLPSLRGRLHTFAVPGGSQGATFRNPGTARLVRERVREILGLASAPPRPGS